MSITDRQAPLQAPCLFGGPFCLRSPHPTPCPAKWLLCWQPAWLHGLDKKMRWAHPRAATKANKAPVAAFPEAVCASGGQGEEGLRLPSAQRGVHPSGSNHPRTISAKSLPGWRLCPAHCLFALGTTQGHILALEKCESGKHYTTKSTRKLVCTPIPSAWMLKDKGSSAFWLPHGRGARSLLLIPVSFWELPREV